MKSIFTKPKVCRSDSGWYVYFRYNNRLKRYKAGLNYIKDIKEKEREAKALAKVLHTNLKKGWNPFDKIKVDTMSMTLIEALDFALEKKKEHLAPKTYLGYRGSMKFVKTAVKGLFIDYIDIKDVKRMHIRSIMDKAKKQRTWSNKAFNKNLNYLKAVLSELIQWDIIESNPAHNIKNLKTEDSRANIPATKEQHKLIKACLENNHPHFYRFILTIFHCGIRPKEILMLQLSMVNLKNREIILPPEITKTNRERIVPINNHLAQQFEDMELNTYPSDFYLFGSYRQRGKGNRGKFIDFIPGHTPIKRDTATKKWQRIVKKGLGIDVNMYSIKHSGANSKILAGMSVDALRELFGHTSKVTTKIYINNAKEIYKNEIIDKSPEF